MLFLLVLLVLAAPLASGEEKGIREVAERFVKRVLGKERVEVEGFRAIFDEGTGLYAVAMVIKEGKKEACTPLPLQGQEVGLPRQDL